MKDECSEYKEVAEAYANSNTDVKGLLHVCTQLAHTFLNDSNMALVGCVLKAHQKTKILELTRAYVTLHVHDLAKAVFLSEEDTTHLIASMISSKELSASLDEQGTVCFLEKPKEMTVQLQKDLQAMDWSIEVLKGKLGDLKDQAKVNAEAHASAMEVVT